MDLNELKNKDCYKVPDNYFEELPKMVFQNIAKQKRTMTIRRSVIAIASLAASILLIVGIIQLRPTKCPSLHKLTPQHKRRPPRKSLPPKPLPNKRLAS